MAPVLIVISAETLWESTQGRGAHVPCLLAVALLTSRLSAAWAGTLTVLVSVAPVSYSSTTLPVAAVAPKLASSRFSWKPAPVQPSPKRHSLAGGEAPTTHAAPGAAWP